MRAQPASATLPNSAPKQAVKGMRAALQRASQDNRIARRFPAEE
jgi:hypothetical protein